MTEPGSSPTDPLRARYLHALQQRVADQSGAVREHLLQRLAALANEEPPATSVVRACGRSDRPAQAPLLAQLRAALAARARGPGNASATAPGAPAHPRDELHSLRRFRETWSKVAAEQQLAQALAQAPQNAGPLNSQRLMLQSLALMRRLSPNYLRHFLDHAQGLQWLEDSGASLGRVAKRSRAQR
ncbi:MAG: DUF2894 domain-containing protein [Rhodoferax sp.]